MFDDLRKPFFFLAVALIAVAVLLEMGSPAVMRSPAAGYGVPSLALLDSLLILTSVLMGLSLVPQWQAMHGRIQGIVTLVVSIIVLIAAITLLFLAIQLVSLMLALLLAPIFGTVAYFALYADFDRSGAAAILSLLVLLKLGFVVCLVLAQQRFLEMKGFVLQVATSLLAVLLVSFLHALVPGFLVSITDMVGAIIVAVLTLIWSVLFLIGSITSIKRVVF